MANFEIPTSPQAQKFQIALAGITYSINLYWCSAANCWVLDLLSNAGEPIIQGIPLVANVNLLDPYDYLNLGGQLIAQTDNAADVPPTYTSLGITGHLYFITT